MPAPDRLHVGILLPTREQAITGTTDARSLIDFATEAEQLGFDSLWAGDSLIARPRLDPLVVLSAAASATRRIGLGTAALTPALRHPLIGANLINSLDHISGGRLTLGLGSGFPIPETEQEFAAAGASYSSRAGRLDDLVGLWRQAWQDQSEGTHATYTGRYTQAQHLDRLLPAARLGGPPLWLAGSDTPGVLRRVARHYDGWLPFLPSTTAYANAWQRIQDLLAQEGRPADAVVPGLYATINVGADESAAEAELDHYIQRYYRRSLSEMAPIQAYCWGSAERCTEWLQGYVAAGARHIILRIGSLTPEAHLKDIARTVLAALRPTEAP
ncbi:LLM class flavin-dependent oxidoreductase [Streptomyces alanosinicus]|uniref:N5,N10-methylene tetrahydromethanopterin reductase n=1 Tax=Streptomyces alanosinicus TaxID=68171 RepID=A0A919D8M6_9ACTN|nr:LLM class flavin-dependent oxidoreductase [Streptomyces alanosinicus]GHE15624.1 N5,N10-methylene tetrahydromethanopterin reductase [Streptomyces alanosinicus]